MRKTLLQFLDSKNEKNLWWKISFYWNHFLNFLYNKENKEEKVLKHAPRVASTIYPEGWETSSEGERISMINKHYTELKIPLQRQ